MVSAAPHWLDNKQTPLLINFSPFPHVSPPSTLAELELDCSWPFQCPGWWEELWLCQGTWDPSPGHPLLLAQTGVSTTMAQWSPIQAHWSLEYAWDT